VRWPAALAGKSRDPGWVPLRGKRPGLRRLLSAGLAGAAVAAGLAAVTPDPPAGRAVVVTTRAVAAGTVVQVGDVRLAARTPDELPDGVLDGTGSVVGRVASAPLTAGEVVTGGRVAGPSLLVGRPPGEVLAPVRVADPGAARLLRPGQRVDVLVAVEGAGAARTVTRGATVLAGPITWGGASPSGGGPSGDGPSGDGPSGGGSVLDEPAVGGGLVLLAVPQTGAAALVQAGSAGPLSVILR
jgi:pilus assembly protein CpaB